MRLMRVPVAGSAQSAGYGLGASVVAVAITTLAIYPLKEIAPAVSTGVVYLLPVLAISLFWNVWTGLFTAVISALSFNFFHIEPTGRLTISSPENLVALVIFLVAAAIVSSLAEVSRSQALEADRRRLEADITADLARILLSGSGTVAALPEASRRLAEGLGLDNRFALLRPRPDHGQRLASSEPLFQRIYGQRSLVPQAPDSYFPGRHTQSRGATGRWGQEFHRRYPHGYRRLPDSVEFTDTTSRMR